eukprot:CAMPEP_0180080486 /NCGR_PEP_ID=MMETSP0985-20121206/17551_1 /TAXON_ID=483367 /ORGANISM="non described non described, Strain CCMP 2436" /LENGTH=156 /DNA_ID=CAMNT_0022013479 /DNA_START=476 /DNA_END=948 /DNA_ORIENTATION=+
MRQMREQSSLLHTRHASKYAGAMSEDTKPKLSPESAGRPPPGYPVLTGNRPRPATDSSQPTWEGTTSSRGARAQKFSHPGETASPKSTHDDGDCLRHHAARPLAHVGACQRAARRARSRGAQISETAVDVKLLQDGTLEQKMVLPLKRHGYARLAA